MLEESTSRRRSDTSPQGQERSVSEAARHRRDRPKRLFKGQERGGVDDGEVADEILRACRRAVTRP